MRLTAYSSLLALALAAGTAFAGGYEVLDTHNPQMRANTAFSEPEDYSSPVLSKIRALYPLQDVVSGESDEFRRIVLLRNWLHRHVVVDRSREAASPHDPLAILEQGPSSGRYSCGHFEAALQAVLSAAGYVTRSIISGPDGEDPALTGTHGSNEVWCNQLYKWVLVDAEWDCHFEKDGAPLSALELRGEYLAGRADEVDRVVGSERIVAPKSRDDQWGMSPKAYAFVSWIWQTNRSTIWPDRGSSDEVVYDDDFFRGHTWYRSGRKHWAYDAGAFRRVTDRGAIEWTPNVLAIETVITGDEAWLKIESCTPDLKEYQMSSGDGTWRPVEATLRLPLSESRHDWRFRAVNAAGVAGPEYHLAIEKLN